VKVSVIIPAYNEEKYIGNCLKYIFDQEEAADEVIVVDNNSTDKTAEIAEKMGARVIRETIQGMIPARNRGFNEARYEIIGRTDADTHVSRNWVKTIKQDFEKYDIAALRGIIHFYDLGNGFKAKFFDKAFSDSVGFLYRHEVLIGPNMALRKSIWEKIKNEVCLNDKKVHEDVDLSIHIARHKGVIMVDKKLLIEMSARRIENNFSSFFIEYPIRHLRTRLTHL
jgi:glycosyltransferase involved in cell wall biosynthesis